jgi:hypothetical protein
MRSHSVWVDSEAFGGPAEVSVACFDGNSVDLVDVEGDEWFHIVGVGRTS